MVKYFEVRTSHGASYTVTEATAKVLKAELSQGKSIAAEFEFLRCTGVSPIKVEKDTIFLPLQRIASIESTTDWQQKNLNGVAG